MSSCAGLVTWTDSTRPGCERTRRRQERLGDAVELGEAERTRLEHLARTQDRHELVARKS
jgi:hypothetical protein